MYIVVIRETVPQYMDYSVVAKYSRSLLVRQPLPAELVRKYLVLHFKLCVIFKNSLFMFSTPQVLLRGIP